MAENAVVYEKNGRSAAAVRYDGARVSDSSAALDLMMSVRQETGCDRIVLAKEVLDERFFILSSGLAGEVLQKAVNYRIKLAIWGDFSRYTSKPLKDFIYESNRGRDVFFVSTEQEAVDRLLDAR